MFGIGATEIFFILVLALIFIGPEKLPEVARTVGRTYREFLRAVNGLRGEFNETADSIKREYEASKQGMDASIRTGSDRQMPPSPPKQEELKKEGKGEGTA